MKAGDRVRVSPCSMSYDRDTDDKAIYRFICEEYGWVILAAEDRVRHVFPGGIIPVRHCKECGQELSEGK